MTERIILAIISVLMIALTFKREGLLHKVILIVLTAGVLITFIDVGFVRTIGIILFILGGLLGLVYAFINKKLKFFEQIVIGSISVFVLAHWLFIINHYMYFNVIRLLMLVPITFYILYVVIKKGFRNPEFGFLTILITDCVFALVRLIINIQSANLNPY